MALIPPAAPWQRTPQDLPSVAHLRRVLLGDPSHFALEQELNPHMVDADGRLRGLDAARARAQWQALGDQYRDLGVDVAVLPAIAGAVDSCFTANPSLVLPLPSGGCEVWLSRMAFASRQPEVDAHRAFFTGHGHALHEMPANVVRFEGCGDGLLHPGRFLLHAGVGPRSSAGAWQHLASVHPQLEVLCYELSDPRYYHLDTALALLDEHSALWVPEAFSDAGAARVRQAFANPLEVPVEEAARFAANAHCPDGRHVLLESGCPRTEAMLQEHGFVPLPVETGEFRKSGGSVFCLKQAW